MVTRKYKFNKFGWKTLKMTEDQSSEFDYRMDNLKSTQHKSELERYALAILNVQIKTKRKKQKEQLTFF